MEALDTAQFVQRALKERRMLILDLLENNGVRDMEHYRHCMGELEALNFVGGELSSYLEKQEQQDD